MDHSDAYPADAPASAADVLQILLDISLTPVGLLHPVYQAGALIDFTYHYLNPAACHLLQLPPRPAESFLTHYPYMAANGVLDFYRDTFLSGKPGRYESNYQIEGQDAFFQLAAQRSGDLLLVNFTTATTHTPTEAERVQQLRQAREQTVAHEQETFQQVFNQTPALVALVQGPEHRFTFVNPAYQRFVPTRPLLGQPYAEVLPEAYNQQFGRLLEQVYETGETITATEMPLRFLDDEGQEQERYFDFTYEAYWQEGVKGVFMFAFEVTARVQAQRQLASQRQLQVMFEQAPAALALLYGPDYVVGVANPGICALWGRKPAECLGRPLFEVLPEVVDQGFPEILAGVRRTGIPFVAQERPVQLVRQDRLETVYFNFVYQPLPELPNTLPTIAILATDVSQQVISRQQVEQSRYQVQKLNHSLTVANEELHTANEELGNTNQQLMRINMDLDKFIYTASHDLKGPVARLGELLQRMRELVVEQPEGEAAQLLELMQREVEQSRQTISQLTDISRLQKAHGQPTKQVRLGEAIEDVRRELAPELAQTAARLDVDIIGCPVVSFSEENLRAVLRHLLDNALKYRHPDRVPKVRVSSHREEHYYVLQVHDNGVGLKDPYDQRLFGMFQRFHSHVKGSGIGLYMVKILVENAGGHVSVESKEGVGSTFFVYLPR